MWFRKDVLRILKLHTVNGSVGYLYAWLADFFLTECFTIQWPQNPSIWEFVQLRILSCPARFHRWHHLAEAVHLQPSRRELEGGKREGHFSQLSVYGKMISNQVKYGHGKGIINEVTGYHILFNYFNC